MKVLKHDSLGDQISKKISAWILIFVATIIAVVFAISFLLSHKMFNTQVNIWKTVAPQYALTNLIDSDHFSIKREVDFLKSTGLFSSVVITDNQKRSISQFGNADILDKKLIPIKDEAKIVWGYYFFQPDFTQYFSVFFVSAGIFLVLILLVYFLIRWRIRSNLEIEFLRFNEFLSEIESVTEKLHEFYNQDNQVNVNSSPSYNSEQIIINRAISRLLDEIQKANKSLREAILAAEQRRFKEELTATAIQVAHDIGSPVAVLETILQSAEITLPEEHRTLIRYAVGRIRDVANTFLKKAKEDFTERNNEEPLMQHLLYRLVNQVISEKKMQHSYRINFNSLFDKSSYSLFALVRPGDFCRVLSNIINNAVDAITENGVITISVSEFDNKEILIEIHDNGKGIPKEVMSKLGVIGKTFGKTHGLGVGLYHAITTIQSWNGRVEIQSGEDRGTNVQIYLPKALAPSWFVSEIKFNNRQCIVIIDDDPLIHGVWKERFQQYPLTKLFHFNSPEELLQWKDKLQRDRNSSILYLCDYEFIGSDLNGIELIKKLRINYLSILVTSRVTDEVTSNCEANGIRLLPKDMSHIIPVIKIPSLDKINYEANIFN